MRVGFLVYISRFAQTVLGSLYIFPLIHWFDFCLKKNMMSIFVGNLRDSFDISIVYIHFIYTLTYD